MSQELFRKIPNVNQILEKNLIINLIDEHGKDIVRYAIRNVLRALRENVLSGQYNKDTLPDIDTIVTDVQSMVNSFVKPVLRQVINATGIMLHTNLGRAPLGKEVLKDIVNELEGYTNLEYELSCGKRGSRNSHIVEILQYLTGAEDAIVVNNNAAAVILVLKALAQDKEVVVSRGEQIEIGGSFRIPDIMAASGAHMVEVGCTNRTKLSDYNSGITTNTAALFKAHRSNFTLDGFVEELSLAELAQCAKKHNVISIYDVGSGLLRKPDKILLPGEDEIKEILDAGIDIVTFSGDKLLGGPQAGIIAGKKELVQRCAKHPLMRSLRVDKLILTALSTVCRQYIDPKKLYMNNPLFAMMNQEKDELQNRARILHGELEKRCSHRCTFRIVNSRAQVGGGSMPQLFIDSSGVLIDSNSKNVKERQQFSEKLFSALNVCDKPVIPVLREGFVVFDVFTITDDEIAPVVSMTAQCIEGIIE